MIILTGLAFAQFAEKNDWLLTEKSDKEDLKLGDDYLCYVTPQGHKVIIRFNPDGGISEIRA